jgi:hypothetical protein
VGQAVLFDREKITYNDERLHEFLWSLCAG